MTTFRDLDEFMDDTLRLPIGGKVYVVPPVPAKLGLQCQSMMAAGVAISVGAPVDPADARLDDDGERNLFSQLLGPAYEQMMADGVSWPRIRHAGMTVFWLAAAGIDLAMQWWNAGHEGTAALEKYVAPNREARRAGAASTGTAKGGTTRRPGSTNGMKSRQTKSGRSPHRPSHG